MYEILLVAYLVIAIALIGFILLQKSKGAGMGASFGAGASADDAVRLFPETASRTLSAVEEEAARLADA